MHEVVVSNEVASSWVSPRFRDGVAKFKSSNPGTDEGGHRAAVAKP